MSEFPATLTYEAAFDAAISAAMREDENVYEMATLLPPKLVAEFGRARMRITPISEPAMTGIAIGSALAGMRPIVNWRNITYAFNSFDQVMNEAAKIHYMFGGQRPVPLVIRAGCGGGQRMAAQHSQSPYSIYAHIVGIKVLMPSSPNDAFGLMRSAIADNNPVICFEPMRLASVTGPVRGESIPIGVAEIKRPGNDVTLVAFGYMVTLALEAAELLSANGISVEVIDPRTLSPLDIDTIRSSVRLTGRLVVADEAPPMCSMASEVAVGVAEDRATFNLLKCPPMRVRAASVPIPFSAPLEDFVLPSVERIVEAVRACLDEVPGTRIAAAVS